MPGHTCCLAAVACLALAVCPAGAWAGEIIIGVNFVGRADYSFGNLAATEVAGAIPQANWNNALGGCGSLAGALGHTGAATAVGLAWTADHGYLAAVPDTTPDNRLMRGHLAPLGTGPIRVEVAGLGPTFDGPYDVLVYFDAGENAADVIMTFEVGSLSLTGTDLAGTDFDGAFAEDAGAGGNYVRVFGLSGDAFTLEVGGTSGGSAAVNALQIYCTPEPATLLLVVLGVVACGVARRRA